MSATASDTPVTYAQRMHDLKTTQANFKAILRLLRSGYRFEDAEAAAVLSQLEKALGHLQDEMDRLEVEWKDKLG
jgi:hypothetical protein